MSSVLDHIHGKTFHGRHGNIKNNFSYGVDYILTDLTNTNGPLFDYGSLSYPECGLDWVHKVLLEFGFNDLVNGKVLLLAQPRIFNHVFNPVSFWMIYDKSDNLRLVIAEVSNTFGDRHSYLCHHDDMSVIKKEQTLTARKVFHVSPFQEMSGEYNTICCSKISHNMKIDIDYFEDSSSDISRGSQEFKRFFVKIAFIFHMWVLFKVLFFIHFHAFRLWFKKIPFRPTPKKPDIDIT